MDLSENVGYIPNEIAICYRDNDQQNHWENGVHYFQTHPNAGALSSKPIWLPEGILVFD